MQNNMFNFSVRKYQSWKEITTCRVETAKHPETAAICRKSGIRETKTDPGTKLGTEVKENRAKVRRLNPREARHKVQAGEALFVCVYDNEEMCGRMRLEGGHDPW